MSTLGILIGIGVYVTGAIIVFLFFRKDERFCQRCDQCGESQDLRNLYKGLCADCASQYYLKR